MLDIAEAIELSGRKTCPMEISLFLRVAAALLLVLGLIGLASVIARRLGLAQSGTFARSERRLQIVESLHLDQKRRVVLLRSDAHEHVVLLGPQSETVLSAAEPSVRAQLEQSQPGSKVQSIRTELNDRREPSLVVATAHDQALPTPKGGVTS